MAGFPDELRRGSDTVVTLDATRLLLAFLEPPNVADLAEPLRSLGLVVERDRRGDATSEDTEGAQGRVGPPSEQINHTDRRFWVRALDGEAIDAHRLDGIAISLGGQLQWIGPVYRVAGLSGRLGLHCPLPDSLIVRAGDVEAFRALEERYPIHVDDTDDPFGDAARAGGYRRYIIDNSSLDSYRLRTLLEEDSYGVEALHENMPLVAPYSMQMSDPLSSGQWNMDRIVASASSPGVISGWDYSLGSPDVIVCVMDTGCDLTHPDLRFVNGLSIGTPGGQGETRDVHTFAHGHGTMCAGIAAATANNLKGLVGVAGRCTILPVAFKNCTEWEVYLGIIVATERGARVISMSFTSFVWNPVIVTPAINLAHARNVVLCAASGNHFEAADTHPLGYPAYDDRVLACGASTKSLAEDRVSRERLKQEGWSSPWGSNFGPGISVVAPGVDVPTTMVQGTGTTGGVYGEDYTPGFFGTSAATPHVAGLAALILSVRPALTADQVKHIIESTADKIGAAPYQSGHPNGSWNQFVGYGRINVLKAMRKAIWPFDIFVTLESRHLKALAKSMKAHEAELAQMDSGEVGTDPALREAHQTWIRLGSNDAILRLVHDIIRDPTLVDELREHRASFLRDRGIVLPDGAIGRVLARSPSTNAGVTRYVLRVEFPAGGLMCAAEWDPELGFSGEIQPPQVS